MSVRVLQSIVRLTENIVQPVPSAEQGESDLATADADTPAVVAEESTAEIEEKGKTGEDTAAHAAERDEQGERIVSKRGVESGAIRSIEA